MVGIDLVAVRGLLYRDRAAQGFEKQNACYDHLDQDNYSLVSMDAYCTTVSLCNGGSADFVQLAAAAVVEWAPLDD